VKVLIKVGEFFIKDYNRADYTELRNHEGHIERRLIMTRIRDSEDTTFRDIVDSDEVFKKIEFYENEQAMIHGDKPIITYANMKVEEYGLSLYPPNFDLLERITFTSVKGLASEPLEPEEPEAPEEPVEHEEEEPEEPVEPEELEEPEEPEEPEEEPVEPEENDPDE
jgi:hypothetical protein